MEYLIVKVEVRYLSDDVNMKIINIWIKYLSRCSNIFVIVEKIKLKI